MKKLKVLRLIALTMVFAFSAGSIIAQGGFIVQPGTDVTVASGTTLDITNGNLLLQDDYSNAPSLLQSGTVHFTGSGDAQVEQYLTKDMWHGVSSPVGNEVNGAYMWIYLMKWVEPTYEWQYLSLPTTQALVPGKGYFSWSKSDNTPNPAAPDYVTLNGTLNHQDVNLSLDVTGASIKSGWNFVGNPFPCAVDWNGNAAWNLTNLDASIWVWDPVAGNYKVWNYNSGGGLQSGEITATQAFWVHATDTTGTVSSSMTIPASQRVHSTNSFYKSGGAFIANQLKLKVQGNTPENDETIIGFMDGATVEMNPMYDAQYLSGNETAPSLFSVLGANSYAMKQLPGWEENNAIPVNFIAGIPGEYTIGASWIESFPEGLPIFLEDKKENFFQDLRAQPVYGFVAGLNDSPDRFIIHFGNPQGINTSKYTEMINIYAYEKTVYVNVPDNTFNEGNCIIFNMMGKKVASQTVTQGTNTIPLPYSDGFYVVTVNSGRGLVTDKVFIK